MAYTQRVTLRETIDVRRTPDGAEDFQGDQVPRVPVLDAVWEDGTTAAESDLVAADYALAIAGSATVSLDLDSLAKGPAGGTVSFAEIRGIAIRARDSNGGTVTLSPNGTNGWTALGSSFSLDLPRGGYFRLWSPRDGALPVGASDKVLDLTNNHAGPGNAIVDILIIGTSA